MKVRSRIFPILISVCLGYLSLSIGPAEQVRNVQKEITRQNLRIRRLLQPTARQKIALAAKEYKNRIISSNWQVDYSLAAHDAIRSQFGNISSPGIDALVQLVMFELWREEEEALKDLLEEMHRMNQAKKKQREYIASLKEQKKQARAKMREEYEDLKDKGTLAGSRTQTIAKHYPQMAVTRHLGIRYPKAPKIIIKDTSHMKPEELEKYIQEQERKMDFINGLSEELSLKLQMLQDRRSKIIQTLSNILKKISQTSDTIISNIK